MAQLPRRGTSKHPLKNPLKAALKPNKRTKEFINELRAVIPAAQIVENCGQPQGGNPMNNYPSGTWGGDPRAPWNEPDPWEGRTCGECRFGSYSSDKTIFVCTFEVIEYGSGEVELIDPDTAACEAFEEV